MIVRVYHDPDRPGVRTLTDNRDNHVRTAREGTLPDAAMEATSRPGSFAYFDATVGEDGLWILGEPSSPARFAGAL